MKKNINNRGVSLIKKIILLPIIVTLFIPFTLTQAQTICQPQYSYKESALTSFYVSNKNLKQKYQYIDGPCWAFANIATLETFLNKKGLLNNESLSEKHLLSWANQGSFDFGWNVPIGNGGNCQIANAYFTSGSGPVLEKECEYNIFDTQYNANYASIKPKYLIKGIKKVENNISSIKEDIINYGAVTAIYSVSEKLNHAVSIIGWDDNNNSWIVKNSATFPNYTLLPYNKNLILCYCITDASKIDKKQQIYQHDKYGVCGYYNCDNRIIAANVFNFDGNETLDSVMLYSHSTNSKFNLYLAPVSENGTPSNQINDWKILYSGTIPYKGYSTFSLTNKIRLNKGKYAIIIQMEKTYPLEYLSLGCQIPVKNLHLNNDNNVGKSFMFYGNSFYDINRNNDNGNKCSFFSIKAITHKN